MPTVTTKDGTKIAYETMGSGPPLILVDGAMCYRDFGPMRPLAEALKDRFTVYLYDRRGRGESGDTLPYAADARGRGYRCAARGGRRHGLSSMAARRAARWRSRRRTAHAGNQEAHRLRGAVHRRRQPRADEPDVQPDAWMRSVAAGRRGAAVKQFMRFVGVPGFVLLHDAADDGQGLEEAHRHRPHPALRLRDRRPATSRASRCRPASGRTSGRRCWSPTAARAHMDAQRPAGAGAQPSRRVPHARRARRTWSRPSAQAPMIKEFFAEPEMPKFRTSCSRGKRHDDGHGRARRRSSKRSARASGRRSRSRSTATPIATPSR